jgi:hypothetical protein
MVIMPMASLVPNLHPTIALNFSNNSRAFTNPNGRQRDIFSSSNP